MDHDCTVFLVDATRPQHLLAAFDGCAGTPRGRGISELFWLTNDELAAFDLWSQEIRVFSRGGTPIRRYDLEGYAGGRATAALPLLDDRLLLAFNRDMRGRDSSLEWADPAARPPVVTLHTNDGSGDAHWLAPPAAAGAADAGRFGVFTCLQQTRSIPQSYAVLNLWSYDVYVGEIRPHARAWHTAVDLPLPLLVSSSNDRRVPAPGSRSIGCSATHVAALVSLHRQSLLGRRASTGVLDIISFEGRVERRFRLDASHALARANFIGLDGRGSLYGVVLDSARHLIIRQPSVLSGNPTTGENAP